MTIDQFRREVDRIIDKVEMASFNNGFESALDAIDELSNQLWNDGKQTEAEALRSAVKELKGENVEA
jgi:soluble cytochrome b562